MASEAPTYNNVRSTPLGAAAAPAAPAPRPHLLVAGSAMAQMAARAEAMRPSAWYAAWEQALLQPSAQTFEGLSVNPGASVLRAVKWMGLAAGIGCGLPAMAILLRTTESLFTVAFGYVLMVGLTLGLFGAVTGVTHALAEHQGLKPRLPGLAFAFAAFAAPLTLAAGVLICGPTPLRLMLLPVGGYALGLTLVAVRAVYGLDWRRALLVALPGVALLSFLPLAAVAGVLAGLTGW